MKATGIVRRIDDLGRVVIPKKVRRAMNIYGDDPFEIFIDLEKGAFCLKKCSFEEDEEDEEDEDE